MSGRGDVTAAPGAAGADRGMLVMGALFGFAVLGLWLLRPALLTMTVGLVFVASMLLRRRWRAGVVLFGAVYPLAVGYLMAFYGRSDLGGWGAGFTSEGYAWAAEPAAWLAAALLAGVLWIIYRIQRGGLVGAA